MSKKDRPYWLTEPKGMAERLRDFAAIASSDGRVEMSKQLREIANVIEKQEESNGRLES